ncbi:MAG: hypothetical protein WDZ94_05350 [Patescibacteria group bacterium]
MPLTLELYAEFFELYQATTMQKARAATYDLDAVVKGKVLTGSEMYLAGLFKNSKLMSGLVFNSYRNVVTVFFGAKQRFENISGGIGGLLEYLLLDFAYKHDIKTITHGRSKVPTGLISGAGLFAFKARYGFSAFPDREWVTTFVRNPAIFVSDAVFITIADNQLQYLVLAQEPNEELLKRYRTRIIRTVELKGMTEVAKQHRQFLTQAEQTSQQATDIAQ